MPPEPDPVDPAKTAALDKYISLADLWERDLYADRGDDKMILDLFNERVIMADGTVVWFWFDPQRVDDRGRIHGLLYADDLEAAKMMISVREDALIAEVEGMSAMTFRKMPVSRQLLGRWFNNDLWDGVAHLASIEFDRTTMTVVSHDEMTESAATCRYRIESIDGNTLTLFDIDCNETITITIEGQSMMMTIGDKMLSFWRDALPMELQNSDGDSATTEPDADGEPKEVDPSING